MKILITGGAGYQGSRLTKALLEKGHKVTIVDDFGHGFDSVLDFLSNKNFSVIKKDIRNMVEKDLAGFDVIYHLAALVGYLACEANPFEAKSKNIDATKRLVKNLSKNQFLVFASTTTFYGSSEKRIDERTKPKPRSVYDITKYEAEKIVMQRKNSTAFRFSSLFGLGSRVRSGQMVNDFVYDAVKNMALILFDPESKRPFLHLSDAVAAYLMTMNMHKKMAGEVFNIGSNNLIFSKFEIAERIKKYVDFEVIERSKGDLKNKRDYIISFDKIAKLGFKPKVSLDGGIEELIKFYSLL